MCPPTWNLKCCSFGSRAEEIVDQRCTHMHGPHYLCSAEDSFLEVWKLGVFQWLCFWLTTQFHTSVFLYVIYKKCDLPTHRKVTVSSKIEERLWHTYPLQSIIHTHLLVSFPMPSASRILSLPGGQWSFLPPQASEPLLITPLRSENI